MQCNNSSNCIRNISDIIRSSSSYAQQITLPGNNATADDLPAAVGFAAAGLAVAFLGSNFLPVKQFDTHDGVSYQMHRAIGIWLIGIVVNAVRKFPQFHPFAMLGGAVCATGNLLVVPIIQTVGMGEGLLISGTVNMLSGWASGRFGWFDIPPQVPHSTMLNYIGVGMAAVSAGIIFFINPAPVKSAAAADEVISSLPSLSLSHKFRSTSEKSVEFTDSKTGIKIRCESADVEQFIGDEDSKNMGSDNSFEDSRPFWLKMSPGRKKIFGVTLSLLSGPAFGLAFKPSYYVQSHVDGASKSGLDYVFSHFTGLLCASMLYFCAYAAAMRNLPAVNPRVILPAVVSGIMWGMGCTAWFLANQVLSESVAFPIITTAPAVVAALWGVCIFKEITGTRNLIVLLIAFITTATGSVINGMSR